MLRYYVLRGGIGFLVGGIVFTLLRSYEASLPGGLWTSIGLGCALFGAIVAFAFEGLSEPDGKFRTWSAGGFLVGGLLLCVVGDALLSRYTNSMRTPPTLMGALPVMLAGACGGFGMGMGLRGPKTGLAIGTASGLLLPLSLWVNLQLNMAIAPVLFDAFSMPFTALKIIGWSVAVGGFVIFGILMGVVLLFLDPGPDTSYHVAGPGDPTRLEVRGPAVSGNKPAGTLGRYNPPHTGSERSAG